MTTIVVFGDLNWFGAADGSHRTGKGQDVIYLVQDRYYGVSAPISIPLGNESEIPVFLHDGSDAQWHASQIARLGAAGYSIGGRNGFHHGQDVSIRIRELLRNGSEEQISAFIGEYTGQMLLDWEDQLAAWATLEVISTHGQVPFNGGAELRALRYKVAHTKKWEDLEHEILKGDSRELLSLLENGPPP